MQLRVERVTSSELHHSWTARAACKPLNLLFVWPAFLLVLPINVSQFNFCWVIVLALKCSILAQILVVRIISSKVCNLFSNPAIDQTFCSSFNRAGGWHKAVVLPISQPCLSPACCRCHTPHCTACRRERETSFTAEDFTPLPKSALFRAHTGQSGRVSYPSVPSVNARACFALWD